jgi:hypothetical protein
MSTPFSIHEVVASSRVDTSLNGCWELESLGTHHF